MNKADGWLTLKVAIDRDCVHVALVLDASESASDHRDAVASLALQTISSLPATANCSVFFLGNPVAYAGRKLEPNVAQWFDENERRASLIGPVVRGLATNGPRSAIAIIGSGRVFDLEDWIESISHLHFILLPVTSPLCASDLANVSVVQNVDELLRVLHDPIVKVDIATPGMVPLAWTNSAYRLQLKDGQFHVLAEAAERFDVRLKCEASGAIPEYCLAWRRSGTQIRIAMTTSLDDLHETDALMLTESEANIFRQAIRRQSLKCPQCAQLHSWDTVYCNNTCVPKYRFKGFPLYPSLENKNTQGLVVFEQTGESVCCEVLKQAVLRVSESRVLAMLNKNKKAQLLDYEPASSTWTSTQEVVDPYVALTDGRYVLNYR